MKAGRLIYALAQLSERERLLLLILSVVVIPLAVVFLAIMPLMQARDAAETAAFEARGLRNWVADQVRVLPAQGDATESQPLASTDPIGISGIEGSLVRVDLRPHVSALANRENGVDVALEEAPFDNLGNWLMAMTPVWGYSIAAFRIEATSPGLVNASFELRALQ